MNQIVLSAAQRGERKGPIAQRWVGEVVSITTAMCEWRGTMTHLTSPALTARAERTSE